MIYGNLNFDDYGARILPVGVNFGKSRPVSRDSSALQCYSVVRKITVQMALEEKNETRKYEKLRALTKKLAEITPGSSDNLHIDGIKKPLEKCVFAEIKVRHTFKKAAIFDLFFLQQLDPHPLPQLADIYLLPPKQPPILYRPPVKIIVQKKRQNRVKRQR